MARRKKNMKISFEENAICVVKAKKRGFDYLPVFPSKLGDQALELFEGTMLKCIGKKQVQDDVWFFEMEVVTGKCQGDTVYVGEGVAHLLEEVPYVGNGRR